MINQTKQHDAAPEGPTSDLRSPTSVVSELIPAPKRGVGRPANYLQIVGERSMPERISKIREYHESAQAALGQGAMYIILTGFELCAVRAAIEHGQWQSWVEKNCPFSYPTAMRYITVAERKYKDIPNLSHVRDFALGISPHLLESGQRQELIEAVKNATDGETVRQMYLDLGMIKGPPTSTATSGPKGPQTPVDKVNRKQELLIERWNQIGRDLQVEGINRKSWANLPRMEQDALLMILETLTNDVKQACRKAAK